MSDWNVLIHREWMVERVGQALVPLTIHGDYDATGRELAALALFEAMSDVSELCWCSSWEHGLGATLWRWLQGEETLHEWSTNPRSLDDERARIVALANASGVWWPHYNYAVPLSDWIAKHGGVNTRRTGEAERLRVALQAIADGDVAGPPALAFARAILAGDSIQQAHAKANR